MAYQWKLARKIMLSIIRRFLHICFDIFPSACTYGFYTTRMERLKLSKGILQPTRSEKENSPGHTHDFISKHAYICMYICVQVAFRIQFSTGMRGAMGGTETTTCQLTFAISGLFPGQIPGLNCSPPLAFRYGLESIQLLFNLLDLKTPCKMHKSLNNILKYVWRYLRIWLYTQIIFLNIEKKITYFKCYVHCVTIIYLTESILKFSCLTQTLISLLLINKMPCLDFQGNSMNLSRTRQVSHFPLRTSHLLAINS